MIELDACLRGERERQSEGRADVLLGLHGYVSLKSYSYVLTDR